MTLQQLRYALEVSIAGSITTAAKKLYIAQPSLSKAISELERELGIRIFQRSASGSALTDEGARFLEYAQRVIADVDRLESRYRNADGLSSSFFVAAFHNTVVVRAFGEVASSSELGYYELRYIGTEVSDIVESVRTHRAEVGILYRSKTNVVALESLMRSEGLAYKPIASVPVFALLGPNNPLASRPSLRLDDLASQPCVMRRPWYGDGVHPVRRLFRLPSATRRIVVADGATRRDLVGLLDGYSLAVGALDPASSTDGLVRVPLEDVGNVDICMIFVPGYPLSTATTLFEESLRRVALASVGARVPEPFVSDPAEA